MIEVGVLRDDPVLGVEIGGYGHALPAGVETIEESSRRVNELYGLSTSAEWVRKRGIGIEQRHLVDPNNPNETHLKLASLAARRAMDRDDRSSMEGVDRIYLATVSADQRVPDTAQLVDHALNLGCREFSMDINAGCSGFVIASNLAFEGFATRRSLKRILTIGVDVLSPLTDLSDRKSAFIFADGAGALTWRRTNRNAGLLGTGFAQDSSYVNDLSCTQHGKIWMNGPEVYKGGLPLAAKAGKMALEQAGLTMKDVSAVIPHHANLRMIKELASPPLLNFPEDKLILTIDRTGNTSSASTVIALSEALERGRIVEGDIIMELAFGGSMKAAAWIIRR